MPKKCLPQPRKSRSSGLIKQKASTCLLQFKQQGQLILGGPQRLQLYEWQAQAGRRRYTRRPARGGRPQLRSTCSREPHLHSPKIIPCQQQESSPTDGKRCFIRTACLLTSEPGNPIDFLTHFHEVLHSSICSPANQLMQSNSSKHASLASHPSPLARGLQGLSCPLAFKIASSHTVKNCKLACV